MNDARTRTRISVHKINGTIGIVLRGTRTNRTPIFFFTVWWMHQVQNFDIHPLDRMVAILCGAREFELANLCSPSNAAFKCCVTHACLNITRIFLQLYEMRKTCIACAFGCDCVSHTCASYMRVCVTCCTLKNNNNHTILNQPKKTHQNQKKPFVWNFFFFFSKLTKLHSGGTCLVFKLKWKKSSRK